MITREAMTGGRTRLAILTICCGVAFLASNDAIAKLMVARYDPIQVVFFRNLIALPMVGAVVLFVLGKKGLRTRHLRVHAIRGLLMLAGAYSFFKGLESLALAEATALIFVAPFFITLISAVFLAEEVGWRRWLAVLAGVLGGLVIIRPGGAAFQLIHLLPVATALVYALLMLSARWVDPRESVWTLLVYLTGAGALLSALIVPFVWVPVRLGDLWLFAGIALFGTAGMTMMTQAFRLAPAVVVAPLDYTALLWATLFGWLIWREGPHAMTFLGAAIIIASGIFTILREQRQAGS